MAKVKENIYRIVGDIAYIDCFGIKGQLTGTIIIDKEDLDKVKPYKWHIENSRKTIQYAQASLGNKSLRMHRLIINTDLQVDHINHNGLDNRKSNLRPCTNAENNRNKNEDRHPISGFKGIRYNAKCNTYYVRIMVNKKEISLGHYNNLKDAIKAREAGEDKYFGQFKFNSKIN